jgi:hypothetical protein
MAKSSNAIITPLDYVFEDKRGREITFKMIDDSETPNRGFRVDELAAFTGDEKVGYLKASYIYSKTFKNFYPSGILNYIDQHCGAVVFEIGEGFDKPATDIKSLDADELNKVAHRLYSFSYASNPPTKRLENYVDFTIWFKTESSKNRKYLQQVDCYNNFKSRIDVPFFDYINTSPSDNNGVLSDNRRLGIGGMLYKVMAKELDKKGMRLHSSSLQQPEAVAAWQKLASEGICYRSRKLAGRLAINPVKFDLEHNTEPSMNI